MPADDINYNVIQITDIHFSGESGRRLSKITPKFGLQQVIKHMEATIPEEKIIVLTGDLVVEPTPLLYKELSDIFCALPYPVYVIPGNHDQRDMLKTHFVKQNIINNKAVVLGKWCLLFLDSSTPGKKLGSGKLSESELMFLDQYLRENQQRHVMIAIHHPPISFGATWFKKIGLENASEFHEVIDKYSNIKAVIFGHAHTQYTAFNKGKIFACSPSAWAQFNHRDDDGYSHTTGQPGYNWYKLRCSGDLDFGTHYIDDMGSQLSGTDDS